MDHEIAIPASLDSVSLARHEVITFLEDLGYPPESAFEVGMALAEALTNAIVHGCHCDPRLRITIHVSCDRSRVCLVVRDPGQGFNPAQLCDRASAQGFLSRSGRGIQMMRSYMDHVAFERGGCEVHMTKSWPMCGEAQSA